MADPFLVIGAMKSGTTTLHAILDRHPDVEVVAEKEESCLLDGDRGIAMASRISSSRRAVAGEVTASYMQAPMVPQPVARALDLLGPATVIVAVLRDPFARAVSHWEHWTQLGREDRPLDVALLSDASPYLAVSRYASQLAPWVEALGADHVVPLRMEDLRDAQAQTLERLWGGLSVSPQRADAEYVHANVGRERVVATGWAASMRKSHVYRKMLRPVMGPDLRRRVLALAGGGRGRVSGDRKPDLERAFRDNLAVDADALKGSWPQLVWESDGEET